MTKTTVVTAQAGLQVDTKISRKELVDMILDEQEAALEDAVEKTSDNYEAKQRLGEQANDSIKMKVGDILLKQQSQKVITDLKKIFPKRKIELEANVSIRERNIMKYSSREYKWELEASASTCISFIGLKGRSSGLIDIQEFNKKDLLKNKEIKALIKNMTKAREDSEVARKESHKALADLKKFKKKGKRARTQFTRELMKNSPEGQAMLAQLDVIKKNTRKLLN